MSEITNDMIPLAEAAKNMFATSTRAELRAYCRECNIPIGPNIGTDAMVKRLMEQLGLSSNVQPVDKQTNAYRVKQFRAKVDVTPPYNLTFNGIWGGRRYRIKLHKPGSAVKAEKGILLSVNGKIPYRVPFGEWERVPAPIVNRLRELTRAVSIQKEDEQGNVTTTWEHSEPVYAFEIQTDPATADRAECAKDWYYDKGPKWLYDRTPLELRQIAEYIQLDTSTRADNGQRRAKNHEELRQALSVHFFGHPNMETDEEVPEETAA